MHAHFRIEPLSKDSQLTLKTLVWGSITASNVQSMFSLSYAFEAHLQSLLLRYFETDAALGSHRRGKVHKWHCKELKEPAYTIEEAERAAGLGRDGKRSTVVRDTEVGGIS
jgi:hypothetical protein